MASTHTAGEPGRSRDFMPTMPTTVLGRWSMWLAVAFIIGFAINSVLVGTVGTSTDAALNDFSRTYLPFWGVTLFGVGGAAGIVALVAIIKDHERSIITLISVLPLAFVALFLLGEFLVPH